VGHARMWGINLDSSNGSALIGYAGSEIVILNITLTAMV
jgi:hypothetical protein